MSEAKQLLDFFSYLEGLRKLERFKGQVFWRDYDWIKSWDSVADHTWRMAMILLVIEKRLQKPIDLERALKMTLIHDIPEIIAGDPAPQGTDGTGQNSHAFNKDKAAEKFAREQAAAREIFDMLPDGQGDSFYELWLAYEEQSSYEAKVVKAIDKLEAKLQGFQHNGGHMHTEQYAFATTYAVEAFEVDPVFQELKDELFREMEAAFVAFEKSA